MREDPPSEELFTDLRKIVDEHRDHEHYRECHAIRFWIDQVRDLFQGENIGFTHKLNIDDVEILERRFMEIIPEESAREKIRALIQPIRKKRLLALLGWYLPGWEKLPTEGAVQSGFKKRWEKIEQILQEAKDENLDVRRFEEIAAKARPLVAARIQWLAGKYGSYEEYDALMRQREVVHSHIF